MKLHIWYSVFNWKWSKIKGLLLVLFVPGVLFSASKTIEGEVTQKGAETVTIQIQGDWLPNIGDSVTFQTEMMDRVLDAGKGEVTSADGKQVVAKIIDGNPNVRMTALIEAPAAIPGDMDADALYELAMESYRKAFKEGEDIFSPFSPNKKNPGYAYFESSKPLILKAADAGSAKAQLLAAKYAQKENEQEKAFEWLEKSAGQGYLEAQYQLGKKHADLAFKSDDHKEKAKKWLKLAVDQSHPEATLEYARQFIGEWDIYYEYMRKAASLGVKRACFTYGRAICSSAIGKIPGNPSFQEGLRWIQTAAKSGDQDRGAALDAASFLASVYYRGGLWDLSQEWNMQQGRSKFGVTTTYDREKEWKEYRTIPVDYVSANRWYEKACDYHTGFRDPFAEYGRFLLDRGTPYYDIEKARIQFEKGVEARGLESHVELIKWYLYLAPDAPMLDEAIALSISAKEIWKNLDMNFPLNLACAEIVLHPGYRSTGDLKIDKYEAVAAVRKAAEGFGDSKPRAMVLLGDLYRNPDYYGVDLKQDLKQALQWYREVYKLVPIGTRRGDIVAEAVADAFARNARAIYFGEGTDAIPNSFGVLWDCQTAHMFRRDHVLALLIQGLWMKDWKESRSKAFEAFSKAAEQGSADAYYWMSECYRKGWGVKKDKKLRDHYRKIAASLGSKEALQ